MSSDALTDKGRYRAARAAKKKKKINCTRRLFKYSTKALNSTEVPTTILTTNSNSIENITPKVQ